MDKNFKVENPAKGLLIVRWDNKLVYFINENTIESDERLRIANSTDKVSSLIRNDDYTIIVMSVE